MLLTLFKTNFQIQVSNLMCATAYGILSSLLQLVPVYPAPKYWAHKWINLITWHVYYSMKGLAHKDYIYLHNMSYIEKIMSTALCGHTVASEMAIGCTRYLLKFSVIGAPVGLAFHNYAVLFIRALFCSKWTTQYYSCLPIHPCSADGRFNLGRAYSGETLDLPLPDGVDACDNWHIHHLVSACLHLLQQCYSAQDCVCECAIGLLIPATRLYTTCMHNLIPSLGIKCIRQYVYTLSAMCCIHD